MIISIKGKDAKGKETEFEAGFKFNNFAFEKLAEIKQSASLSGFVVAIMYVGYKGWCFAKQIDERLTFEDFSDYVDLAIDDEDVKNNIAEITKECAATSHYKKASESLKKNEVPAKQKAA